MLTVTDDQSIIYTDTIAIVILNQNDLDALLQAKWNAMNNYLSIGDTSAALTYISSATRSDYEQMFNVLTSQLPAIVATETSFNLLSINGNKAKYKLMTNENGTIYSYDVILVRDQNGIWMIHNY